MSTFLPDTFDLPRLEYGVSKGKYKILSVRNLVKIWSP